MAGGRARSLLCTLPDGSAALLDNGQHILIGAYRESLALMRRVGIDPTAVFLRMPLSLVFPDGSGLRLPDGLAAPFDVLVGIATARGWSLSDKLSLYGRAARWRFASFACKPEVTVQALCSGLSERVVRELVEPLCLSALNVPLERASGQVFLRVLRDAVLGSSGDSHLLLPRTDLSSVFPDAAVRWLEQRGTVFRFGERVGVLERSGMGWRIGGADYGSVILSTTASDAARIVGQSRTSPSPLLLDQQLGRWGACAGALRHEAISTVYAWGRAVVLPEPMLALRSDGGETAPAQFVFDRGRLGGPGGLLAFVVSASSGSHAQVQQRVLAQAQAQLGLQLHAVQTVVEKRATFACTPALARPAMRIAPGLLACGDYVEGPYPSTLEGAVRAGGAAGMTAGTAH